MLAPAQAECQARGWPWREPAKVTGGLFRVRVWTNANMIGDNPWFVFSRDGRLMRQRGPVAGHSGNASSKATPKRHERARQVFGWQMVARLRCA